MVEMRSNMRFNDNPTNNGFLSGFVEGSVEMPADGKNGDCIVHYKGEYSNCKLKIRLSNGVREGIGTIVKDGAPFIQIEYHQGVPNGSVCRMDDYGNVELKGELMNGMESGLFLEYDSGDMVVWRGYYWNGVRYSEVVESGELVGYYDERSVSTGSLLSIAQYDDSLQDKNGRCFEYENGSLKNECVYANGVKKRSVREFVDGKMIVFNSDGKKVYEGRWFGDIKSGFLCHEPMEGIPGFFKEVDSTGQLVSISQYDELNVYRNGIWIDLENGKMKQMYMYENGEMKQAVEEWELFPMILSGEVSSSVMSFLDDSSVFGYEFSTGDTVELFQLNRKCFSVDRSEDICLGVMVDLDSKEMTEYMDGGLIDVQSTIEVIDMDANGRRWEGGVKDGKPYGYGVIYDEEGRKEYDGFMDGGKKTGYGIEYYSDIGRVRYEGCYFYNNRFGKGILYDRNGSIEYEGLWKDNEPCSLQFDGDTVYNHTESIDIPNDSFNESSSFILPSFIQSLKRIVIGDYCFGSVRLFELNGLNELESIMIGKKSFRISSDERRDGVCRIVNCPKLKSIQIGYRSFSDYHSFELSNLPSLHFIDIGGWCFEYASSFSLTGLID